jgi:pyruvate formate lyase activating enzyme
LDTFPKDAFLRFLDSRKDWLEAVCVSGGEPLLHQDIGSLFRLLKEKGLRTKLDTNGSFPDRLLPLLEDNLLDFVAMDVKAPLDKYSEVTRTAVAAKNIKASIDIILASDVEYVFRTTVVRGLVSHDDLREVCRTLSGAQHYALQSFSPGKTLDESFQKLEPFSQEEFSEYLRVAREYFPEAKEG